MQPTKLSTLPLAAAVALFLPGCEVVGKSRILMITSTTIGVNIQASKSQQTPEVKIGYNREEFALLPTDRPEPRAGEQDDPSEVTSGKIDGAYRTPEALMELNANSNLGLGVVYGGGVYQRLAVGAIAVSQPGAAIMMAKNQDGTLSPEAARTLQNLRLLETPPDIRTAKYQDS